MKKPTKVKDTHTYRPESPRLVNTADIQEMIIHTMLSATIKGCVTCNVFLSYIYKL